MPLYPPDSSGADARLLVATKTVAQNITGAIGDVSGMSLTLAANATYHTYLVIPVTTVSGTGPTLTLGFTGPASPTLVSLKRRQMNTATADVISVITSFTTFAGVAVVASTQHLIEGVVKTSAGNGGVLQLRAAAGGTIPSITIAGGALMYAIKVG